MDIHYQTDEFLAVLGHEMRNPLNALSHALQVWSRSESSSGLMDELRHIMERQVRQLTRLSDDLLDLARLAQGKLLLRREAFELQCVIADSCEEIQPLIERYGHELTVDLPDRPMIIFGDPSRLTQVFVNLLQNAAKFTARNGHLSIALELQDEEAVVRVRDNGCGIEADRLASIFEGLPQVNPSGVPDNDGLGIGLKLIKTVVELHDGNVSVRSQGPGCGTEFTVRLPVASHATFEHFPESEHINNRINAAARHPPAYRILVVDDDQTTASLLAWMLRSIDQVVTVAYDGESALQAAMNDGPQIVILDIKLPDVAEFEIARRLREYPMFNKLVLIALSVTGEVEHQRRGDTAGINVYVDKPTSITKLSEVLCQIHESRDCLA